MDEFYGKQHIALQQAFDTVKMADAVKSSIVVNELADEHKGFIESRDFFFLTTIDHRGYPTCSHKGGSVGFVKALDSKTLVFPGYDGNGMFLSMGNMIANPKVGMLFIDFATPHRVRVHGEAKVDVNSPLLSEFPGAELIVTINITEAFVNCPRYIHKYQRIATSKYAPQKDCTAPFAQWKRIDSLQESLPERDKHIAETLGEITMDEYVDLLVQGKA